MVAAKVLDVDHKKKKENQWWKEVSMVREVIKDSYIVTGILPDDKLK